MVVNKFGVPCSKLSNLIKDVDVYCTSEEEAMALAAGAWFTGAKPEVYMQNTGLIRSLNILLTLYLPFNIPFPKMLISNRRNPLHHWYVYKFINESASSFFKFLHFKNKPHIVVNE